MNPRALPSLAFVIFAATLSPACNGGQGSAGLTGNDASQAELTAASTYTVQTALGAGLCLVPAGGSLSNGTALSLGDCNSANAMGWSRPTGGTALVLAGTHCLDVVDGATANGTLVQLWDCFEANTNQRWSLSGNQLMWMGQTKCLDVTDGVTTPEVKLQIWDCDATNDHQIWKLVANSSAPPTAASGVLAGSGNNTDPATSAVGNGNIAASPNAAPTYRPADLSALTTAWVRQTQTLSSAASPQPCITVSGFPGAAAVQSAPCGQASAQVFAADGNGHLSFPSQNVTANGQTYGKNSYCLTAADPAHTGTRIATLTACNSGDANQLWGQAGTSVVSMTARTCLSAAGTAANANVLTLSPCTTHPQQAWTLTPSN